MDIENNDNGQLTTFIPERPSDIAEVNIFQDLLEPLPSIIQSTVKKLKEESPELKEVEIELGYLTIPHVKAKIRL